IHPAPVALSERTLHRPHARLLECRSQRRPPADHVHRVDQKHAAIDVADLLRARNGEVIAPQQQLRRFNAADRAAVPVLGNAGVPARWSGGVPPPRRERDAPAPAGGTPAFRARRNDAADVAGFRSAGVPARWSGGVPPPRRERDAPASAGGTPAFRARRNDAADVAGFRSAGVPARWSGGVPPPRRERDAPASP